MKNKIIWGDCLLELKELKDNSIDSIVTDPPYGLSFMGKKWDYEVPSVEVWKECLRVLKPGGHLLSFAGSRTYHRIAVNIEDAGFDIRDQIMWIYGSGFPKSLNIGKAVDKLQGNVREDLGEMEQPASNKAGGNSLNMSKMGMPDTARISEGNSAYEGLGTALKPAHEPIVVARKPISEKNIALNVLKWGTAGINIDGCRIESSEKLARPINDADNKVYGNFDNFGNPHEPQGRFPANIIFDEEAGRMLDEQSGISNGGKRNNTVTLNYDSTSWERKVGDTRPRKEHNDKGGASRFFYCAKASKSERNKGCDIIRAEFKAGAEFRPNHMKKALVGKDGNPYGRWGKIKNNHPTVKPIKLMRYLVRLVTPKGGLCLDPFIGSGTTAIACKLEGFNYLGIERESDYIEIAESRIEAYQLQEKLNG